MISDVELSRAVNALSTTLRDQRPARFEAERMQLIVDGSLGGERRLHVRHHGGDRGTLTGADGSTLASIDRRDGRTRIVNNSSVSAFSIMIDLADPERVGGPRPSAQTAAFPARPSPAAQGATALTSSCSASW